MRRATRALVMALVCAAVVTTACQTEQPSIDRTPLPTVAAPPYICDYIPLRAVELMTGIHNPLVRGSFDLTDSGGIGFGSCAVYQREGERLKVMLITLGPGGDPGLIEGNLNGGALPLPEVVPGAIGSYFVPEDRKDNDAYAHLVRGPAELIISLEYGAPGRDNGADVVALMKLIAPKLITDASAPSATPSPKEE